MKFGELDVCRDAIRAIGRLAGWNSGNWTVWRDGIREIGRLPGHNSGNWTFGGMGFGKLDVWRDAIRGIGRLAGWNSGNMRICAQVHSATGAHWFPGQVPKSRIGTVYIYILACGKESVSKGEGTDRRAADGE